MIYIHRTGLLIVTRTSPDGVLVFTPELAGCVSQGDTETEALENIDDAIVGVLAVIEEDGLPNPLDRVNVTGFA